MRKSGKKITSFLLCFAMLLAGMAVPVNADESNYISAGTERYDTLGEAITSSDAEVLEVVGTVTDADPVSLTRDMTLIGSGTLNAVIYDDGYSLTLGDGSQAPTVNGNISIQSGNLTVEAGAVITSDNGNVVELLSDEAAASFNGATITAHGENGILAKNGACIDNVSDMNIYGNGSAICLSGTGTLLENIAGGTYNNSAAAGTVSVMEGARIGEISSGSFTSELGSAIEVTDGSSIDRITGGSFSGTDAGMCVNGNAYVGQIDGGTFRGGMDGINGTGDIGEIGNGTFIGDSGSGYSQHVSTDGTKTGTLGCVSGGIFYGNRYAMTIMTDTYLEPQITGDRGLGRFYGGDGIFSAAENAKIRYPEGYSMSAAPFTEQIDGYAQGFSYLVRNGSVSATVTGSDQAAISVSDGEKNVGSKVRLTLQIPEHEELRSITGKYVFDGTEYDLDLTKEEETGEYVFDMPVGDVSITAEIEPETFIVGFDAGELAVSPDSRTVEYGNKVQAPEDVTADGYVLEGWYKDRTLTDKWDFTNDTITEDITLFAHWVKDTGELTVYSHTSDESTKIYRITGEGVDLKVSVKGDSSVTIKDIPSGEYTVTREDWSWRDAAAEPQTVTVQFHERAQAEFRSDARITKWLDYEDKNGIDL